MPDPNILTTFPKRPSGIAEDKIFESNESVKGAAIEGSNANLDAFKFIKGKRQLQDDIDIKDILRTTCIDRAFKIILIDEGVVEIDEFSCWVQSRSYQISSHSTNTCFT